MSDLSATTVVSNRVETLIKFEQFTVCELLHMLIKRVLKILLTVACLHDSRTQHSCGHPNHDFSLSVFATVQDGISKNRFDYR